jgi:hypothetical protein
MARHLQLGFDRGTTPMNYTAVHKALNRKKFELALEDKDLDLNDKLINRKAVGDRIVALIKEKAAELRKLPKLYLMQQPDELDTFQIGLDFGRGGPGDIIAEVTLKPPAKSNPADRKGFKAKACAGEFEEAKPFGNIDYDDLLHLRGRPRIVISYSVVPGPGDVKAFDNSFDQTLDQARTTCIGLLEKTLQALRIAQDKAEKERDDKALENVEKLVKDLNRGIIGAVGKIQPKALQDLKTVVKAMADRDAYLKDSAANVVVQFHFDGFEPDPDLAPPETPSKNEKLATQTQKKLMKGLKLSIRDVEKDRVASWQALNGVLSVWDEDAKLVQQAKLAANTIEELQQSVNDQRKDLDLFAAKVDKMRKIHRKEKGTVIEPKLWAQLDKRLKEMDKSLEKKIGEQCRELMLKATDAHDMCGNIINGQVAAKAKNAFYSKLQIVRDQLGQKTDYKANFIKLTKNVEFFVENITED